MSSSRRRGPPLLATLTFAAPLVVLAVARLAASLAGGPPPAVAAERTASQLDAWFEGVLERSARIVERALAPGPAATAAGGGVLAERLEGLALLDGELDLLTWTGTPVDPPEGLAGVAWPRWTVRRDGVRTRLLVKAGPDELGRLALASFVVDSLLDQQGCEELLPDELRSAGIQIEWLDSQTAQGSAGEGASHRLGAPRGPVLALARIAPPSPAQRRERVRDVGEAAAAILFAALLGLWRWRRREPGSTWTWLADMLALGAGRAALHWAESASVLLPRALGSPSLYGSAAPWGLLASPADMALSAATLFLAATTTARYLHARRTAAASALAVLLALGASAAAAGLVLSIAHDSRSSLLDRPAAFGPGIEPLLWASVALALLGAARLGAVPFGSRSPEPLARAHPALVGVIFVALVFAAALVVQRRSEKLALEQLGSQYAPAVLEQSARRELTLTLALREIRERYADEGDPLPSLGAGPDELAFRFWSRGELFHSGYKSSLTFYSPTGAVIDSFAFDLPPLVEPVVAGEVPAAEPAVKRELFDPVVAVQQRLLHGEVRVERGHELLGVVVGHVLDEPDNLPFLPASRPYLAALGAGSPHQSGVEFAGGPEYVLYDAYGTVELTTLRRPPPDSGVLREAAALGEPVRVAAGDAALFGLALGDDEGRLHLLLLPARGTLERLAAAVRLALLALLSWAGVTAVSQLVRHRGPRDTLRALRGSFYRKLLAALLLASVVPLVGLAVFLRGYVERRGEAALIEAATGLVGAAQRQVEEYAASQLDDDPAAGVPINDDILYWLRGVLGQEIHIYENGRLVASSRRELFSSGLLPPWLDGAVQRRLSEEGLPSLVAPARLGPTEITVAYAPVRLHWRPAGEVVVAVPLVLEPRQIERATDRVGEMILLATVALVTILAAVAALIARTVARPVRELVGATARIADGNYDARLLPRTRDELADLVRGFNTMAGALERQRGDLERRRDYMEALLHHATTGVISLDPLGRVVTLNPAAAELLAADGARVGEGTLLAEGLAATPALRPLAEALRLATRRSGEPADADVRRRGEARRLRLVSVELDAGSPSGRGRLVLVDDVTDLTRSNQLAAWAEMARAIAHEIKNPLTPIQLSAEHLARLIADRGLTPDPQIEACLETIVKQVRALHAIAAEFSAYAKLWALQPVPADPVAFMRETVSPYAAALPRGVRIEQDYAAAPEVSIDRRVLTRAVTNLLQNAIEALEPEGGVVRAGVRHDVEREEVVLSVADSGPGLEPEVRDRLFEPYFSTKTSGTGLGLAIALRAVEAHGGRIEVSGGPGRGTTFDIRLPVAGALPAVEARAATARPGGGT